MGLAQSLYTGWTGLATHQRSLDNTGNNLANANTVGFKRNEFLFTNLLNQVVTGAMGGDGNRGSVNPKTIGSGVTTGAIMPTYQQGPMEPTGRNLDVAINGNGFFLVNTASGQALTRNGSFYLDYTENPNERMLLSGDGYPVQGWMASDGLVTPTTTVGNIYLPAEGDLLPGKASTSVTLDGILPSNATGADFTGNATREISLQGNMNANGANSIQTSIHVPVTRIEDGVGVTSGEIQEVKVRIDFTGPNIGSDLSTYDWTMTTIDWPNPGDPPVQVYPPANSSTFEAGTISFYNNDNVTNQRAAGQAAAPTEIKPGSSKVSTSVTLPDGTVVDSSFNLSSAFTLDVSRLTNLPGAAPGGNQLQTWYVDGNAAGTIARTITVFDEVTRFETVTNADGTESMQAVRRVEARQNLLSFAKTDATNNGSTWSWRSSIGPESGELQFNTIGDLTSSTSSGGPITYDFTGIQSMNYAGSMQAVGQDGFVDGFLRDISIDQFGRIFGHYSNDVAEPLAQLALATVPNLTGLSAVGGTLYYANYASGDVMIGVAGDKDGAIAGGLASIGAGTLTSQHLEGSNVELATEFTQLISTERGYQANARVITTTDEMLQQLVSMKR